MNEQRQTAYLNLIQELLSCPSFQEPVVLAAHSDLIDTGLVETMEQVAAMMGQRGNPNAADFLQNLAQQIAAPINKQRQTAYLNLIDALLQYPRGQEAAILESHRELVDIGLIQTMEEMAAMLAAGGTLEPAELLRDISSQLARELGPSLPLSPPESPERREAYLNLIDELLACPSGGESVILMTYHHLIDAGLVQMMERVANAMVEKGEQKGAQWLRKVADQLKSVLTKVSS